jgi:hypothetical protein
MTTWSARIITDEVMASAFSDRVSNGAFCGPIVISGLIPRL